MTPSGRLLDGAVFGRDAPLVARGGGDVLFRRAGEDLTADRFLADAHALAGRLPECDHLINLCLDRYCFVVSLAAAMLRGQVTLLASNRSPDQARRLGEAFARIGSVSDDGQCVTPFPHLRVALPEIAMARGGARPANPRFPAETLAAIVYTSGSTGDPVAHRKSWGALAERSAAAGLCFGMTEDAAPPSIVGTVPPQHMYGFETTVLQPLHSSASSWCGAAGFPADIRDALAAVPEPRILVTTPLQLRSLVESGVELPGMRAIVSATAPMDAGLAGAAERRFGAPVREIFGATEVGSIASRRTTEGDLWTMYRGVSLTDGGGAGAPPVVEAPWATPHPIADVIEREGADRFRLLGRPGDLVKLGGRRASLAGLTRILNEIEGVSDGVFVAPDDLDRRPAARLLVFAIASGLSPADVLAALRARIDPVFLPRRVVLVGSLPRNELGKLPREEVRRLMSAFADGAESGRGGA